MPFHSLLTSSHTANLNGNKTAHFGWPERPPTDIPQEGEVERQPAVEPESLPVCVQVLKWNLGAGRDAQSVDPCVEPVMDGDDA